MKKFITLLLALVIMLSLIPMNAMALNLANKIPNIGNITVTPGKPDLTTKKEEHNKELDLIIKIKKKEAPVL